MDKVAVFQTEKKNSMVQIQLVPINIFSQVCFLFIYIRCTTRRQLSCRILLHILATTFLQDTFTYFDYFFLFGIPCGLSVFSFKQKRQLGIYLLSTRKSRKRHANSLAANARFTRNILVSWMDFSSIHVHVTTFSLTINAILFF